MFTCLECDGNQVTQNSLYCYDCEKIVEVINKSEPIKLGLCKGRHDLPCTEFIFEGKINPLLVNALEFDAYNVLKKYKRCNIDLYVTGLTVALISAINACSRLNINLTLFHYDRDSDSYYPQKVR